MIICLIFIFRIKGVLHEILNQYNLVAFTIIVYFIKAIFRHRNATPVTEHLLIGIIGHACQYLFMVESITFVGYLI